MFIMADVIDRRLREFDALGLDQYGRPKGCTTTVTTSGNVITNNTTRNDDEDDEPTFPFVMNHNETLSQKADTIVNITLTDAQFEKLLDVIESSLNK